MAESTDTYLFLGQAIRHYRLSKGWTRKFLAAKIGCTTVALDKVETGQPNSLRHVGNEAAEVLGLPENLYGDETNTDRLPMKAPKGWRRKRMESSRDKALKMNVQWQRNRARGATKEPTLGVFIRLPVSLAAQLVEDEDAVSLPTEVLSATMQVVAARELIKRMEAENGTDE